MINPLPTAVAIIMLVATCAAAQSTTPSTSPGQADRVSAWKSDIEYFATELPKRHPNAFHRITQDAFDAEIAKLKERLETLSDTGVILELTRIAALIGDGHTMVVPGPKHGFSTLPVLIRDFADGPVIVAASAEHVDLLGARVLGIGDLDFDSVTRRLSHYVAAENRWWVRYRVMELVRTVEYLVSIDPAITVSVPIRVRGDDGEATVRLSVPAKGERISLVFSKTNPPTVPDYAQRRNGLRNWQKSMGEGKLLYVRYNVCSDEPNQSVRKLCDEVLSSIKTHDPKRVLIDLRGNSGGNSSLLRPLIQGLAGIELTRRGDLFVATDRATFSSGLWNAIELKAIGAKLIGEPAGSRPNHYGEVRTFQLPSSGVVVQYSTKYWKLDRTGTDPDELAVDIPIEEKSSYWFAGRDAIVDYLLKD